MLLVAWGVAAAQAGREWKHPSYPIDADVGAVDAAAFQAALEAE